MLTVAQVTPPVPLLLLLVHTWRLDSNGVRTASDVQQNKVKGMCAGGIQNEIDLFVGASVGDEASRGDDLSQRSGELLDSGVKDDSVSFRIRLGRSRKTGKS